MFLDFLIQNINYIAFILCAVVGGVTHYLKKYLKKETTVKMSQWFGKSNSLATIYTFIMFFFVLVGTISSGVISTDMNFWACMYSGFMTGFAIDSGLNSDAKQITSDIVRLNNRT